MLLSQLENCNGMAMLALIFLKWLRWEAQNALDSEQNDSDKFDPFVESLVTETEISKFIIQILMVVQYVE